MTKSQIENYRWIVTARAERIVAIRPHNAYDNDWQIFGFHDRDDAHDFADDIRKRGGEAHIYENLCGVKKKRRSGR
jgi:hypothetical protein